MFARAVAAADPASVNIGYVLLTPSRTEFEDKFEQGLKENGYDIGRTAAIDYRPSPRSDAEADALIDEFVAKNVDAIVGGGRALRALHRKTTAIPFIFCASRDAVADGLVKSLARPASTPPGNRCMRPSLRRSASNCCAK